MPTSIITNTILDLNSTPLSGVGIRIELVPKGGFRSDNSEIVGIEETETNASGIWSVSLERNSNITPANSYYQVREYVPDSQGGERVWAIQVGDADATLFASLVTPVPAGQSILGDIIFEPGAIDTLQTLLQQIESNTDQLESLLAKRIKKRFDISPTVIYVGSAALGTSETAAAWSIQRITFLSGSPTVSEWSSETAVWNDRALVIYT